MIGFSNKKGLDSPPSMWDANASANVKIASFLVKNDRLEVLYRDVLTEHRFIFQGYKETTLY
jgi:hypothetical protein